MSNPVENLALDHKAKSDAALREAKALGDQIILLMYQTRELSSIRSLDFDDLAMKVQQLQRIADTAQTEHLAFHQMISRAQA
jgi:hypothetical protein